MSAVTPVPGLIGKNLVDLQITAHPAEAPTITEARGAGLRRRVRRIRRTVAALK